MTTKWNDPVKRLPPNHTEVACKLKSGKIIIAHIVPIWQSNYVFGQDDFIIEWTEIKNLPEQIQ